jgi:hypothetical protein
MFVRGAAKQLQVTQQTITKQLAELVVRAQRELRRAPAFGERVLEPGATHGRFGALLPNCARRPRSAVREFNASKARAKERS